MYILGINSVYHESSACLVHNGEIVAYAEEERLNRIKHGKYACVANIDLLPEKSIEYCLKTAGICSDQISQVGLSFTPEKRLKVLEIEEETVPMEFGDKQGEAIVQQKLLATPDNLRKLLSPKLDIRWLDHHLCHAASAFFVSPFEESAIMVIDGIAEFDTVYLGMAKGNSIDSIKILSYPNSVGFLWEKIAKYLGYTKYDAGKIMGLGAYGDSNVFFDQFCQFICFEEGQFFIDNNIAKLRSDDNSPLEAVFGIKQRQKDEPVTEIHAHIVAGLQKMTEKIYLHLANYLHHKTNSDNVCLAGGVALNCQANTKLAQQGKFKNIFIPPHCNDAGTSIGAALYLSHQSKKHSQYGKKLFLPYWKTHFSNDLIATELNKSNYSYQKHEDINRQTASLLAKGKIVAYYQGGSEIGPRALGNRSILASTDNFMIKETLNFQIKQREFFRPYAPLALKEHLADYFEPIPFSLSQYYMLFVMTVKKNKRHLVPGITHIDGTSRVQIVDEQINPNIYELLQIYFEMTGIPMLLNTSYNRQEPIVHSPQDAVETFSKIAKLKFLVMGNYLVRK